MLQPGEARRPTMRHLHLRSHQWYTLACFLHHSSDPSGAAAEAVLTVDEAAKILRISRTLAFAAVREGALPSVRIGRRVLVPRDRLEAFLRGDPHP